MRKLKKTACILAALLAFSLEAHAAGDSKNLWKEWYLYSSAGKALGYYQEEAEERGKEGQLALSQRWWEKDDGGGTVETYIGSVAKNDADLTPVAFFVERTAGTGKVQTDARLKNGSILIRKADISRNGESVKYEAKFTKGLIFSSFMGMLLAKHMNSKELEFQAIVEDNKDDAFAPQIGRAVFTKEKKKIRKNECFKASLQYLGMASEWWFTNKGKVCEVYMPSTAYRLELSSEKEALGAFKKK